MKTALVTGASEGIGAALVRMLIDNDFLVLALARSAEKLDTLKQTLNDSRVETVSCDLRDSAQITGVMGEINKTHPCLDILVNNAGVGFFEPIMSTTRERWQDMLDVNLTGAFMMIQAGYPLLKQSVKPHIFNICSTASRKGFMNCGAYSASKFGLLGFTEVLREEFRPLGIKVTAVIPGAVNTPFWSKANSDFDRNKMLNPDSVARVILQIYNQDHNTNTEEIIIKPSYGDF